MTGFPRETTAHFPSGSETLFRRSVIPASPLAHLGIIHGYGDHGGRYAHLMAWMAERGVACHAVDLRGQGQASGRRGFVRRWDEYVEDLLAFLALEDLQSAARNGAPLLLLGHSHGGLVLAAAVLRGLVKDVRGCVFSAPFFRSRLVIPRRKLLLARLANPFVPWLSVKSGLSDTWMTADPAMREQSRMDPLITRIATPRWFLGQLRAQAEVMSAAPSFRSPLLMLAGDADVLADSAAAVDFYDRAGSVDKTVHLYPGMLHELLREADRLRVFSDIYQWLAPRIPLLKPGAQSEPVRGEAKGVEER